MENVPQRRRSSSEVKPQNSSVTEGRAGGDVGPTRTCKRGIHILAGDNLIMNNRGRRQCRACKNQCGRKWRLDRLARETTGERKSRVQKATAYTRKRRRELRARGKGQNGRALMTCDEIWDARKKTHCPASHELIGENLCVTRDRKRICRKCRNALRREYHKKRVMRQFPIELANIRALIFELNSAIFEEANT